MMWPIGLFILLFVTITWHRFEHGLFLFFLLLPTYLIRFSIFGIPTTLLEMMFWILFAVWLLSSRAPSTVERDPFRKPLHRLHFVLVKLYVRKGFLHSLRSVGMTKQNKLFVVSIALFLLGATVSIFTAVDIKTALGEWKAFYIEPVILFLILATTLSSRAKSEHSEDVAERSLSHHAESERSEKAVLPDQKMTIVLPLILCGLAISLLAIYQHFTGWMVPYAFWENRQTYRVTAWYGFPNGIGLFLAPLVPLSVYGVIMSFQKFKEKYPISNIQYSIVFICSLLFVLCSLPAIIFAKSTGAIVGITAGIGFLLLTYKKTRWPTVVISILCLISIFSLVSLKPIKDELFFADRSGQIRLAIYDETFQLLKDRPFLGAGLASYEERIVPYHQKVNGESIEIFHHPHNIFLTIWVNTGLLGLIGFIGIIVWCFYVLIKDRKTKRLKDYSDTKSLIFNLQSFNLLIFALASLIVLLVSGLVDSPYIKNDLAFLFWAIIALIFITQDRRNTHNQL